MFASKWNSYLRAYVVPTRREPDTQLMFVSPAFTCVYVGNRKACCHDSTLRTLVAIITIIVTLSFIKLVALTTIMILSVGVAIGIGIGAIEAAVEVVVVV